MVKIQFEKKSSQIPIYAGVTRRADVKRRRPFNKMCLTLQNENPYQDFRTKQNEATTMTKFTGKRPPIDTKKHNFVPQSNNIQQSGFFAKEKLLFVDIKSSTYSPLRKRNTLRTAAMEDDELGKCQGCQPTTDRRHQFGDYAIFL